MDSNDARNLHLLGATGVARVEQYQGREHLVVPVVALMEGVIHAVNAETPEFVPALSLSAAPHTWNGRPLVVGHPTENGRQISANSPAVLEKQGFGHLFASRVNDGRLGVEAWADVQKLERLGQHEMLRKLRAGEPVEVSVGAFVTTDSTPGTHNGKAFKGSWREIMPDHLAFLPASRGACSVEMGCGSGRHAQAHLVTAEGITEVTEEQELEILGELRNAGGPGSGRYPTGSGHASYLKKPGALFKHGDRVSVKTSHPDVSLHGKSGQVTVSGQQKTSDETKNLVKIGGEFHIIHPDHLQYLRNATEHELKGASMSVRETLREKVKELIAGLRTAAPMADKAQVFSEGDTVVVNRPGHKAHGKKGKILKSHGVLHKVEDYGSFHTSQLTTASDATDTPSEVASEEAAELIGYTTLQTLLNSLGDCQSEASSLVEDLIADEEEDPTNTAEDEAAEEEVETARLEAIQTHCATAAGIINSVLNLTMQMLEPDLPEPNSPRYMEAMRAAMGARHSSADMMHIQGMHDSAVALGADCTRDYKVAEAEAEPVAPLVEEQVKVEPVLTTEESDAFEARLAEHDAAAAATLKAACSCEEGRTEMTPEQKTEIIRTLVADSHSGFIAGDEKMLTTASDERLESFRVAAEARSKEVKAAKESAKKPLTPEEFMEIAPSEIKTLVARQQQQETDLRAELVTALKTAQEEYTESELAAMPIQALERMGRALKLDQPAQHANYIGRGMPRFAAAKDDDVFSNPPDGYALAIAARKQ